MSIKEIVAQGGVVECGYSRYREFVWPRMEIRSGIPHIHQNQYACAGETRGVILTIYIPKCANASADYLPMQLESLDRKEQMY
jgi:hypothetical protein